MAKHHRKTSSQKRARPSAPASHATQRRSWFGLRDLPAPVVLMLAALAGSMFVVVTAMTAWTHNLDDVKVPVFTFTGPLLLLGALILLSIKAAPAPPKIPLWALIGFGITFLVSILLSEFRWIGWHQLFIFWSAAGFFLAAAVVNSRFWSAELFLRFLVLQLLVTNLVGFTLFDFTGSSNHNALISHIYVWLNGQAGVPTRDSGMLNLLWTFYNAENEMLSTILNRDFYAGFCLLFLPIALRLSFDPGPTPHPRLWRSLGLATSIFTVICIFYCQSKGEYIFFLISMIFFGALFYKVGKVPGLRTRYLASWLIGMGLLLGGLAWMKSPTLMNQLKAISVSTSSRSIIWFGSLNIFKDFPIFGGGPGTFRIYFPAYRAPDYFEHEISHVTLYSHNYFLDLLCETGLIGLTLFMIFLGGLFILGLKWAFRHGDTTIRGSLVAVLSGILGFMGSNLSSPNARWVIGACAMWTMVGVLAGLIQLASGKTPDRSRKFSWSEARFANFLPVLLLALLMLLWSANYGTQYFKSETAFARGEPLMRQVFDYLHRDAIETEQAIGYLKVAADDLEQSSRINPHNLSSYYKRGSIYSTLSRLYNRRARNSADPATDVQISNDYLLKAMNTYETLSRFAPDYAEIHYNLGIVYDSVANRFDRLDNRAALGTDQTAEDFRQRALDHLERMGRLSLKPQVARLRGDQYLRMGYLDKAVDVYGEASTRYPDNITLAKEYYRAARQAERPAAQIEALTRLWHKNPAQSDLLNNIVLLSLENGLHQALGDVLEHLERINPIHPLLYYAKILRAHRAGQSRVALQHLQRYIQIGGQRPEVYWAGAEAARRLGRTETEQTMLRRVLRVDAEQATTYSTHARQRLSTLVPQPRD